MSYHLIMCDGLCGSHEPKTIIFEDSDVRFSNLPNIMFPLSTEFIKLSHKGKWAPYADSKPRLAYITCPYCNRVLYLDKELLDELDKNYEV